MNNHEALAQFPWNEALLEPTSPLNRGLATIIAFTSDGQPKPVGSGFLISSDAEYAMGLTAAHVFDEIARFHSKSAYGNDMLVPAPLRVPEELDLSPARLAALAFPVAPPVCAPCTFTNVWWDSASDVAVFRVKLPTNCPAPPAIIQITDDIPAVGEVVAMLGYADSEGSSCTAPEFGSEGRVITITQRLVMRVGRVTAHHDAHFGCKGPCVETSIPIFSGMSGCLVARLAEGQPVRAFGLASHDPEPAEPEDKKNRAIAGSSIVALLNAHVDPIDANRNSVRLALRNAKSRSRP